MTWWQQQQARARYAVKFGRQLARARLSPKLPAAAWWACRTLRFDRPVRFSGRVWVRGRSARIEWLRIAELLQALEIFSPLNPWNAWEPSGEVSTVVDLGANIGQTVAYWALRFPGARLGAVEMMPENAARIERHGRLGGWKLAVLPVAAAGEEGSVTVRRSQENTRHRLEEIVQTSAIRDLLTEEKDVIPALPLDKILDRLGFATVDLMKIDVEGAEVMLLRDLGKWGPRVGTVFIEIHDNVDHAWARRAFETAGFQVHPIDSAGRTEWRCSREAGRS